MPKISEIYYFLISNQCSAPYGSYCDGNDNFYVLRYCYSAQVGFKFEY